jgi:hypothetical protein
MLTTIFAVFAFCFVLERLVPGWSLPQVRSWPWRVLLVNGVQLCVVLLAGLTWERWLSSVSLFHLRPRFAGGRRIARLLHRHIRFLLVASFASRA